MKQFFLILTLCIVNLIALGQKEELVIHRTHSSDIELLEFSRSGKFLASLAKNSEIIIWHVKLNRLLTTFYIDDIEIIKNMSFSEDEKTLYVKTRRTVFAYDIVKSKLRDIGPKTLRTNRAKNYYKDKEKNIDLTIKKGTIIKRSSKKRITRYRVSANSIETKLTSFDVSPDQKLIIAGAEDGSVYVYKYGLGVLTEELSGKHNSDVLDVRFTEDGKYFASAGKDRSIIIWSVSEDNNFEIENRISSSIYRKNTVTYSPGGNHIYVGDESGYVYEIDLSKHFPKINVAKPSRHSVNKIIWSETTHDYFIATSNNEVLQKLTPIEEETTDKFRYKQYPVKNSKSLLFQKLGVYQPPFGQVNLMALSPDNKKIIYSGVSDNPNISIQDIENRTNTKLYKFKDWNNFNQISFLNDSTIIGNVKNKNVLYFWQKISGDKSDKYLYKTDTLPFDILEFKQLDHNTLWLNTSLYGQYKYTLNSRKLDKIMTNNYKKIFKHEDYIIMIDFSNAIVFYNYKTDKRYFTFRGHSDLVTDISFHPDGNKFVTSSYDGTIKIWDLNKKSLIITVIPFKSNDFIFITKDNHYLISKSAINEFGFKYKDQYFYPDLFDIKYNRPDKVLIALGVQNKELIAALVKARERRMKKLNYTEEQLEAGTERNHVPEIEIANLLTLPSKTKSSHLDVELFASDSKYPLERINIWVNGVAIYGIKGYKIQDRNLSEFKHKFTIPLANGKNKIEFSAFNSTGVESFKKTFKILNTSSIIDPNLYLITIGASKFKDNAFNLNYAAKDARDIATIFKNSKPFNEIFVQEYTNEKVTKENIIKAKKFLEKATINDMVIVFIAGHGVLDENFDYFFASHEMNFNDPKVKGIPYAMIESLVDNLRALKKILFIDTCHSGEFEKDEVERTADLKDKEKAKDIIFRSGAGVDVKTKDDNGGSLGLQNTNELMKTTFNDLRKGTGATIISSSGGTEYAIEGEQWKNGLFTYCLIRGLREKAADSNRDKKINIIELQEYIQEEVKTISKGAQTPTSRIANTQLDYRIW